MKTSVRIFLLFILSETMFAQISIHGTITQNQSGAKLQDIEVNGFFYNTQTGQFFNAFGPTWTESNGFYSWNYFLTNTEPEPGRASFIKYIGNRIYTNSFNPKIFIMYNIIGEEVKRFTTSDVVIDLNFNGISSGRYLCALHINNEVFTNLIMVANNKIFGVQRDEQLLSNKSITKKSANIIGTINILDDTHFQHSYEDAFIKEWSGLRTFNLGLPKVTYLPDSMQFTEPGFSYPINTEMRLLQYMKNSHYPGTGYDAYSRLLTPIKFFIDTVNCPIIFKQPIRNGINHIRSLLTLNPDSILVETSEYKPIQISNGFCQANFSYVDSVWWEWSLDFYMDLSSHVYYGFKIALNKSTTMEPMDIFRWTQLIIQHIFLEGVRNMSNPKYLANDWRGEPYYITDPEINVINMALRFNKNVRENNDETLWLGNFRHPYDNSFFSPQSHYPENTWIKRIEGNDQTKIIVQ